MIVSDKQQAANRRNAQQSTGPRTQEGKDAVRFNALTWGLYARNLLILSDDPKDYQLLWDALAAEWQPQTDTELHYLEQMCASRFLLTRTARSEAEIYDAHLQLEKQLGLLDRVSVRRVRLERSFTAAMHELQQLQKVRRAQPQPQPQPQPAAEARPPVEAQPAAPSAPVPPAPPGYVMSEAAGAHPVSCAPANPDTR